MKHTTKRAVVLGAGASCSYAESPSGQLPPLADQIIRTYFNLDISTNRFVLVGNIVSYVQKTMGINADEFIFWNDDIERFLTEIDEEIVALAIKAKSDNLSKEEFKRMALSQGVYNQFIFLFASILNEIQNGPVSIPYALLANELTATDTCISFNWDTLLDRALSSTGNWSPLSGYSIIPEAIYDDGWQQVDRPQINKNQPQYLKLHGSTNWLAPYHFVDFSSGERRSLSGYAINKLFVYLKSSTEYQTYENRYWGPYEPYSYCYYPPNLPCKRDDVPSSHIGIRMVCAPDLPEHAKTIVGDEAVYAMPLIVPPVRDKQYLRYGKIFSTLWEKASESLSQCEELIMIGYSFPPTDHVAKNLFREALKINKNLKKVIIWNPSPSYSEELFVNEFGVNKEILEIKKEKFNPLINPESSILS